MTENESSATIGDLFGDKLKAFKMKLEGIEPEDTDAEEQEEQRITNNVNKLKEFHDKNIEAIILGESNPAFFVPEMYFTLSGALYQDTYGCKILSNSIFSIYKFPAFVVSWKHMKDQKITAPHIMLGKAAVKRAQMLDGSLFPVVGDANLIPNSSTFSLIRDASENGSKISASIRVNGERYLVLPLLPDRFYDNFYPESELWDVVKEK